MSAALQLPFVSAASYPQSEWVVIERPPVAKTPAAEPQEPKPPSTPVVSIAFYRKHTENLLRRYLYASMSVGRSPAILGDPVARGMVSNRPVKTFEDAVIFVLDIESCLDQLGLVDRMLLSRIVLQDYSQFETAALIGMSIRSVCYRFPKALDHLTEILLKAKLLVIPRS